MGGDVRTSGGCNLTNKMMLSVNLNGALVATVTPNPTDREPEWWVVGINLVVHIAGQRKSLHLLTRMFTAPHKASKFINDYFLNVYNSKCELPNDEAL